MFEKLWVGELWFIAVQRNYLIIFHLSPATRSCVRTRSLKMEGKVKGEKVETVLKNIKLRSCCCPRCEREQSHWKLPEDTSVGFGPCLSKTCSQVGNRVNGEEEGVQLKWISSQRWIRTWSCRLWFPVPALVKMTLGLLLLLEKPVIKIDGGYLMSLTLHHRVLSYLSQLCQFILWDYELGNEH